MADLNLPSAPSHPDFPPGGPHLHPEYLETQHCVNCGMPHYILGPNHADLLWLSLETGEEEAPAKRRLVCEILRDNVAKKDCEQQMSANLAQAQQRNVVHLQQQLAQVQAELEQLKKLAPLAAAQLGKALDPAAARVLECLHCFKKHLVCDGGMPCSECVVFGQTCRYKKCYKFHNVMHGTVCENPGCRMVHAELGFGA
ncbi:hypothetical protein BU16DRAFT_543674 [Lophium mytilinum]|uniref:Zn(2)-C6 fungal-type domain-containing protein n=1 Tax=Lophium mytilinum TaxID=390894 RepID=A0A6A6QFS0_9PEZI|nr:hypothetical protein BU16DRAFT_543674 [Lophium mytilinum]